MMARTAPDPAAPEIRVRQATASDAAALAAFAAQTFTATYARGGDGPVAASAPDDVATYVRATFTPARLRAELDDPALVTFIAEAAPSAANAEEGDRAVPDAGDRWAGYAQLRLHPSPDAPVPPSCAGPHPRELARLYVQRAWQGRGVADQLVDAVIARAEREPAGTDPLWLGVYQANARAVAFYRRRGFVVVGATTFAIGAEVQNDWLMAWRAPTFPPAAA